MILDPFRCLVSDTKLAQVLQLDQLMVTTMSSFEDNIVAKGVGGASLSAITAITSEQLWTRPTYCIVTSASVNGNLSSDTLLKWFGNILGNLSKTF